MTSVVFTLAGQQINPPVDWQTVRVLSRFDNDSVQAYTDIDNFEFVNEAGEIIRDHIDAGNIFIGIPFSITITGAGASLGIFNGYVDCSNDLRWTGPNQVFAKIAKLDTLDDLSDKIAGITFGLLASLKGSPAPAGSIGFGDYTRVQYLVERENNGAELALLSLTVYLMSKQIAEDARDIAKDTAQVIAVAAAGITGAVAAFVLSVALLLIRIAFSALLIIALVKLIKQIVDSILPFVQNDYGITFRIALTKVFEYLGYTFTSPINDLDWIYLPSKPEGSPNDRIGIPNPQDYGYRAIEMVDAVKLMFHARFSVDENTKTIELRSLNDPFWRQSSSWVKPDVLNDRKAPLFENRSYNTDKMNSTHLVLFTIDQGDFYTIQNYRGTAYEISTVPVQAVVPEELNTIKGLDETRIPLALGVRKDDLSALENAIKGTVNAINAVIKLFGGNGINNPVQNRVGLLKKGSKYHYIPKVIQLNNQGRIPPNPRDTLSAKYLWNNYISYKSLVANDFFQQAIPVVDEPTPFTLADQLEIAKNKWFTLKDGRVAEMTSIQWGFDQDTALLSYDIHEVYTTNITEEFNETE